MGELAIMIRSYLDDPEVALMPQDPVGEVRANTWTYEVLADDAADPAGLVAAIDDVASGLRSRWVGSPVPARFHAWYDAEEQALRCSVTTCERLPYPTSASTSVELAAVVGAALADAAGAATRARGILAWSRSLA